MDLRGYLEFLGNNLLFNIPIILIGFILGWFMYSKIILRKINLKDALFEKDNLAAWIEFLGAFIFPTLYLAAKAIEGPAHEDVFMDLLICIGYEAGFIVLFTVLRLFSNLAIRQISPPDIEGKISLNNEVYNQKNVAASLFSATLSIVSVSVIMFMDFMPEELFSSLFKMLTVVVYSLMALIVYEMVLRSKTTLFKEIFVDNNPAAGVALGGFVLAVETILTHIIQYQLEFDFIDLMVVCAIGLAVFLVLAYLMKWIFAAILKVNIWAEVYEQNNMGAAIGQVVLYVSIANIIIHFLK
ncbi:MAG TPA: hypothetical protein VIO64_14275 [Pseudobacteroides sp.]|uniref:DUF350 domain-containing protein n=1 Tax=Pseudobacteroides sp. TaxID=1968840 RepID=UPI002F9274E8